MPCRWGKQELCFIDWWTRPTAKQPEYRAIQRHLFTAMGTGCVGLVWEGRQEVVELCSIMRRVYVVPPSDVEGWDCSTTAGRPTPGIFWLSAFKWDSVPPDYRSMRQLLAAENEDAEVAAAMNVSDERGDMEDWLAEQ